MCRRITSLLWAVALSLIFLWQTSLPAWAQTTATEPAVIPTQTYQIATEAGPQQVEVFNFMDMSLRQFPPVPIDQTFLEQLQQFSPDSNFSHLLPGTVADPTQYLQLGSIAGGEAFGVGQLSIEQIAATAGVDLNNLKLGALGDVVRLQTPEILLNDLPELGNLDLAQVKPIRDLAIQFFEAKANGSKLGDGLGNIIGGNSNPGQIEIPGNIHIPTIPGLPGNIDPNLSEIIQLPPELQNIRTVSDLVRQVPEIGQFKLGVLGDGQLMKYDLKDIPGITQAPLDQLSAADGAFLKDLNPAGLGDIPLAKLPVPPKLAEGIRFAVVDVPLGDMEQQRLRSIAGTIPKKDVFSEVECLNKACPHLEIRELTTSQHSGFAWLDGRMKAKDGYGPLCLPFGCKGPVGNHPFGKAFRVILTKPNEAKGEITVGLKFRACKRIMFIGKTCTPYFFPPNDQGLVIGQFKEKQIVPFVPPGKEVSGLDYTPQQLEYLAQEEGSEDICGGGAGVPIDLKDLQGVADATINVSRDHAVDAGELQRAQKYIPHIMKECAAVGLTNSDQLAYAIATARHETDYFRTMEEYDKRPYDACGVGEGMIQVTHCDTKELVFRKLGLPAYGGIGDKRLQNFDIAAKALCRGLKEGWYGQGRPIADCFRNGANYTCARQQVNDHDDITQIADHAKLYQRAIEQARTKSQAKQPPTETTNNPAPTQNSSNPCGASVTAGSVNDRIFQSAKANKNKIPQCNNASTLYGKEGCAYAVDEVLRRAGLPMFGGSEHALNIVTAIDTCSNGSRGTLISQQDAKPGDILIMDDGVSAGHIGICMSDQCRTSLSNSSSSCVNNNGAVNFGWMSDDCFSESYGCTPRFKRYFCRVKA
jgi:hypothetical protein